jgi:hypothetical protein
MKIIDIGICVDNMDPKHMGRIRINRYSDQTGVTEGAFPDYEKWGDRDLFVASPFLPLNSNFIPEIGQAVKIINYNTEKDVVNMEYISGPFTNMHDFNGQNHTGQLKNTSYGSVVKAGPDVIDSNGNYINPKSEGAFAKHKDHGIYGKYGSDVIFTENGVMMRGGKFRSKKAQTTNERLVSINQPIMANKSANLYLKKFPTTIQNVEDVVKDVILPTGELKYIVEYELDPSCFDSDGNFVTNATSYINFYIYQTSQDYSGSYRIENGNLSSIPLYSGYTKLITNISDEYIVQNQSGRTDLTISIPVTSMKQAQSWVRNFIKSLHTHGLDNNITDDKNKFSYTGDIHPFFYRPVLGFESTTGTTKLATIKTFLNGIDVYGTTSKGLIYSKNQITPQPFTKKVLKNNIKEFNGEQTFSALKSDKVYLLSTDTNLADKSVDFFKLDPYELSQMDYIDNIDKNTYSTVRGENLVSILYAMRDLLESHIHDIGETLEQSDPNFQKLDKLFKTLENDILNNSIRIN